MQGGEPDRRTVGACAGAPFSTFSQEATQGDEPDKRTMGAGADAPFPTFSQEAAQGDEPDRRTVGAGAGAPFPAFSHEAAQGGKPDRRIVGAGAGARFSMFSHVAAQGDEPDRRAVGAGAPFSVFTQEAAQGGEPDRRIMGAGAGVGVPFPAFSLSRPAAQVLPTALTSALDGESYAIDADFRTVLACLRRLTDPDMDALTRLVYLGKRFFRGRAPRDMDALFAAFVAGGAKAGEGDVPLIDFEQDAGAIFASFWMQYGIDLTETRMHWLLFRELVAGLGEDTPLGLRVKVRAMPDSRVAPEDRAQLRALRERFAIAPRVGQAEQALLYELDKRLAAGEDPAEILRGLAENGGWAEDASR